MPAPVGRGASNGGVPMKVVTISMITVDVLMIALFKFYSTLFVRSWRDVDNALHVFNRHTDVVFRPLIVCVSNFCDLVLQTLLAAANNN